MIDDWSKRIRFVYTVTETINQPASYSDICI